MQGGSIVATNIYFLLSVSAGRGVQEVEEEEEEQEGAVTIDRDKIISTIQCSSTINLILQNIR